MPITQNNPDYIRKIDFSGNRYFELLENEKRCEKLMVSLDVISSPLRSKTSFKYGTPYCQLGYTRLIYKNRVKEAKKIEYFQSVLYEVENRWRDEPWMHQAMTFSNFFEGIGQQGEDFVWFQYLKAQTEFKPRSIPIDFVEVALVPMVQATLTIEAWRIGAVEEIQIHDTVIEEKGDQALFRPDDIPNVERQQTLTLSQACANIGFKEPLWYIRQNVTSSSIGGTLGERCATVSSETVPVYINSGFVSPPSTLTRRVFYPSIGSCSATESPSGTSGYPTTGRWYVSYYEVEDILVAVLVFGSASNTPYSLTVTSPTITRA